MTNTDRFVYKLHRISGLVGGLFLLMLTLTGCILLFDNLIDGWLSPATVLVKPGPVRQPYDAALRTLHRQYPTGTIRGLALYPDAPARAIRADVRADKKRLLAYVNPYTGAFLGERDVETVFVRGVHSLHEHLLAPPVGDWILLLVGLCLIGSVLTGTWYYRKSLASVFSVGIRWNKPRRILYGDLHKYLGVVSLVFLLLMGVSGTFFHWEKTVDKALSGGDSRPPRPAEALATAQTAPHTIDAQVAISTAKISGFRAEVVSFPDEPGKPVVIRGNAADANPLLGKFTAAAEFDSKTGQLTKIFRASEADTEYKAEHILEELHFGRFGGLLTKTLYFVLSLAMAIVTTTGLLIWWVKR